METNPAESALRAWFKTFHRYQGRWIAEPSPVAVMVKARQVGISHASAASAVKDALIDGSTNIILSASQSLSSEVLAKARAHSRVLVRFGYEKARVVESNSTRISFENGGRVIALPASPRTARSFTGNVYFDEFAYHDDPQAIWDAAAAMATRQLDGGRRRKIRVISTPNGAQGLFYDWAHNVPQGWALHKVTVDDAIRDGMCIDLAVLHELAGGDDRVFAQWYRCSFLDGDLQFIPTEMADRCFDWDGKLPKLSDCDIFAGLDVARTADLTALAIVAVHGERAHLVTTLTCRRKDFRAQRRMIDEAREMFRWTSLHVDQSGIGRNLAEELVEDYGDDEVVTVDFTNAAKADLATRSLRWLRDDRIRLPRDAEGRALRDEMIAVRRTVTTSGNICYDVARTNKGHGDRWWALCLALKGAGEPQHASEVGSVPLLAVA